MFMYVFFIFLFFLSRMHVSYFVCVFANSIKKKLQKKKHLVGTSGDDMSALIEFTPL